MDIYVNDKTCVLPESSAITDALQSLAITARNGIAIAVNSTVVPRQNWETYTLKANDKLMIIKATQGG